MKKGEIFDMIGNMLKKEKSIFLKGVQIGVPIGLGYLAVSFALGITARNAGMTVGQATLTSLLVNASAGEYAGFRVIAESAGYAEMILMQFVANIRYLLMSCALSQKMNRETGLLHRMLIGFAITDEIFGASIAEEGKVNPFYHYGMISIAIPCWAIGTFLGVVMGNFLPERIVSSLSVALYGMFIAIIIPPARKNRVILGLVIISMMGSFLFSVIPGLNMISSGIRTVILTVFLAGTAAVLFPVKEECDAA